MEDLGEVRENFVEFFRCLENTPTLLQNRPPSFPPSTHGNLLASSSRFGFLFVASASQILVFEHHVLRENPASAKPSFTVDFSAHGAYSIYSLALLLDDTALALHSQTSNQNKEILLIVSVPSLARGNALLLPSPSLTTGIKAVAVCPTPPDPDAEAQDAPQNIAVLLKTGLVELHLLTVHDPPPPHKSVDSAKLSPQVPTCIAISPGDELLAVGTERGSVSLYDTETASLRTTIVAVESGWIPFAIHFAAPDAILVSYGHEDMVNHVVWTIAEDTGDLAVKRNSPLGELCFASPPSLPPSEDGHPGPTNHTTAPSLLPVISCCPVPGWDVCVVASSLSTDLEVIALNDDGIWENWKLDEGKSATLPTDSHDNDTKPIGIAFDLTDTAFLDSLDPSAPHINPMPRLITFTTDFLLLPFKLIDERPDVSFEYIRKPSPLPPECNVARAGESPTVPIFPVPFSDGSDHIDQNNRTAVITGNVQGQGPSDPLLAVESSTKLTGPTIKPLFESDGRGFSSFTTSSVPLESNLKPIGHAFGQIQSRDVRQSDGSRTDEEEDDLSSDESLPASPESEKGTSVQLPQNSFSETSKFLSNFQFPSLSEMQNVDTRTKMLSSLSKGDDQNMSHGTTPVMESRIQKPRSSIITSGALPKYPPQPSLVEASSAAQSGRPIDCIRSIMLEMAEELRYNKQAEQVTKERIQAIGGELKLEVESTAAILGDALQVVRGQFQEESSLRKKILTFLKEVTALNRDYENISLQYRIREEEGVASSLHAEDKAVDERIVKKESEVLKSLSAIDERINADRIPRDRHVSQAEQIQQIYSSLSLQGFRIRKVHNLLVALSDRMGELDKGHRRSDLGLSIARLERLSIGSKRTIEGRIGRADGSSHEGGDIDEKAASWGRKEVDISDETSLASNDTRRVLRRLAMRGGRANICAKTSRVTHGCHSEAEKEKKKPASHDLNSGIINESMGVDDGTSATNSVAAVNQIMSIEQTMNGENILSTHLEKKSTLSPPSSAPTSTELSSLSRKYMQPFPACSETFSSRKKAVPTMEKHPISQSDDRSGSKSTRSSTFGKKSTPGIFSGKRSGNPLKGESDRSSFAILPPNASGVSIPNAFGVSTVKAAAAVSNSKSGPGSTGVMKRATSEEAKMAENPTKFALSTYAAFPPDETELDRQRKNNEVSASKPKQFAALPPDTDDIKQSQVHSGNSTAIDKDRSSSALPSVDVAQKKAKPGRSLFASLPPDDDIPTANPNRGEGIPAGPLPKKTTKVDIEASPFGNAANAETLRSVGVQLVGKNATENSSFFVSKATVEGITEPSKAGKSNSPFGAVAGVSSSPSLFSPSATLNPPKTSAGPSSSRDSTTGDSDLEEANRSGDGFGMDTSTAPVETSSPFGAAAASSGEGLFGMQAGGGQNESSLAPFGHSTPFTSSDPTSSAQAFGGSGMQRPPAAGFGSTAPHPSAQISPFSAFGPSSSSFNQASASFGAASPFAATAQFGSASPLGGGSSFGTPSQLGSGSQFGTASQLGGSSQFGSQSAGGSQFGAPSPIGSGAQFGASSQLGAGFGATSQLGQGASPFGIPALVPGGFGSGSAGFGGATSSPSVGGSSFGMGQQHSSFGGASVNSFGGMSSVSPFGNLANSGFGGHESSGSGFAALAGSQSQGFAALAGSQNQGFGTIGSGFGSGGAPVFGSNNAPPSFTSAAFAQRRA